MLWLALVLVTRVHGDAILGFNLEARQVTLAQSLENDRVTMSFRSNLTLVGLNELTGTVTKIFNSWAQLPLFLDPEIADKFKLSLTEGKRLFDKGHVCYTQTLLYTSAKTKSPLASNCKFTIENISDLELRTISKHLVTVAASVVPTWDVTSYKADTTLSMRKALTDLVTIFNTQAQDYCNQGCSLLSSLDLLAQAEFPEALKGQLESATCIPNTVAEKISVTSCISGNGEMVCELEVGVPLKMVKTTEFILLNYFGFQLDFDKDTKLVRDETTGSLKIADCEKKVTWSSDTVPLCRFIDIPENCKTSLETEAIDDILTNCLFKQSTPLSVIRLHDEGLLIQNPLAKVREDSKALYHSSPFVIYTNNLVTVNINGEELTFPPLVPIKYSQILTSKLDKAQLERLKTLIVGPETGRTQLWATTLMDYVLLALQAVFGPMAMGGLIFTCVVRRKQRAHLPVIYERTIQRRSNMLENVALLNRTN